MNTTNQYRPPAQPHATRRKPRPKTKAAEELDELLEWATRDMPEDKNGKEMPR